MKGKRGQSLADDVRPRKKKNKLDAKKDFDAPLKKTRTPRLPGMEDPAIQDLEDAAMEHSETQSQIVALREELKRIDERLATLMKREGKKTYNHAGIVLRLREGQERVSVKVKRHEVKDAE
jgi:hypothetical protein